MIEPPNLCCFCLSKTHKEIKPTCAFCVHGARSPTKRNHRYIANGDSIQKAFSVSQGYVEFWIQNYLKGGGDNLCWLSSRKLRSFNLQALVSFFFSFIFNGFWSIFKKMIFYYHFTCFPFYLFSMSVRKDICSTCLILLPLTWLHRVLYSITLTLHQWCPFGGISGIHVVPNGFFWQGWTLFTLAHLWR